jgi:hypothetical protein
LVRICLPKTGTLCVQLIVSSAGFCTEQHLGGCWT